jgi:hypothetical protein
MPTPSSPERLRILEMIESGTITPAQGLELLQALGDEAAGPETVPQDDHRAHGPDPSQGIEAPEKPGAQPDSPWVGVVDDRWKLVGQVFLGVGSALAILGGYFLYRTFQSPNPGIWFYCAWLPLVLGLGMAALAWYGRTARWLHIRVRQKPGERPERIAISLPVPLRLTAWALRIIGRFIPALNRSGIDELILALDANSGPGPVLLADVSEGEDGERVQLYLS